MPLGDIATVKAHNHSAEHVNFSKQLAVSYLVWYSIITESFISTPKQGRSFPLFHRHPLLKQFALHQPDKTAV